jgi:gamma-glutamylcyclotransferase (GGCT)/AIG2-like uncharacterized protein YtfP
MLRRFQVYNDNLFVYGTLMRGSSNYDKYLAPWVKAVLPACIKGELYHLPEGYPALLEGGGTVRGELIAVPYLGRIIGNIDVLEDYYGPEGDNVYRREVMPVELMETRNMVDAFVYIFCDRTYALEKGIYVDHGSWKLFMTSILEKNK